MQNCYCNKEPHEADEGAALTIKFESGVTGTFICSDNVVSPFNFESGTGENPTIPQNQGCQVFIVYLGLKVPYRCLI